MCHLFKSGGMPVKREPQGHWGLCVKPASSLGKCSPVVNPPRNSPSGSICLCASTPLASAARRGLTAGWAFFAGPVTVCLVKMLVIAMLFGAVVPFEVFAGGDAAWQVMASNALAVGAVERVLYERTNDPHFYIHVRITNQSGRPIGADLRDYWQVIYPNQWGLSQDPNRRVIDERRITPVAGKSTLVPEFAGGRLTRIAPGQSVDYYREFNASSPRPVRNGGDLRNTDQILLAGGLVGDPGTEHGDHQAGPPRRVVRHDLVAGPPGQDRTQGPGIRP